VGFGLQQVPFYNPSSGALLGSYSDFVMSFGANSTECMATGAFSFNKASDGMYHDTITISFSCQSEYNAVSGGTGIYGCAQGYEGIREGNAVTLGTNIVLCGGLCPH
jgi:hypothetical protein